MGSFQWTDVQACSIYLRHEEALSGKTSLAGAGFGGRALQNCNTSRPLPQGGRIRRLRFAGSFVRQNLFFYVRGKHDVSVLLSSGILQGMPDFL